MSNTKTFSTGFDKSKLHTYKQLLKMFKGNAGLATLDCRYIFLPAKNYLEKYVDVPLPSARVLEVGCGTRFGVTLLFHSMGAKTTGIDMDVTGPKLTLGLLRKMIKCNGLERTMKTLARRAIYDREYYQVLQQEAQIPLNFKDVDVRYMNACEMEFTDEEFDFVCSNAVLEHIDDPGKAVQEIHRVLKPDGVASIGIHLYASISGGHNLEWQHCDVNPSKTAPPWDHLRQNLFSTHVYLNKWREKQYLEAFGKYFSTLEIEECFEGKNLLTDEIRRELPDYTDEELLKRSIRIIARKK